jgi:6-phosphogluconolactonase
MRGGLQWRLYEKLGSWTSGLCTEFRVRAFECLRRKGSFLVGLSGGQTPLPFYEELALCEDLPWESIHWWLGDERWVDPSDPRSNEGRIHKTLGRQKRFGRTFRSWHLSSDPQEAADRYAGDLVGMAGNPPALDLFLLGIGPDGHTASLFPGSPLLAEKERLTGVVPEGPDGLPRVTVTLPVLCAARCVWFLVRGQEKRGILDRLSLGDPSLPAALVHAETVFVQWSWR